MPYSVSKGGKDENEDFNPISLFYMRIRSSCYKLVKLRNRKAQKLFNINKGG